MKQNLKLPLRFEQFFRQEKLDCCELKDSVFRNLHLLITTTQGENTSDEQYGSVFWDADYDIHLSNDARRELVRTGLKRVITRYEPRLAGTQVEVSVRQAEFTVGGANRHLRRRIEIVVTGRLVRTNEPVRFSTGFFIGPLSYD